MTMSHKMPDTTQRWPLYAAEVSTGEYPVPTHYCPNTGNPIGGVGGRTFANLSMHASEILLASNLA